MRFDSLKPIECRCNICPLDVPFGAGHPRVFLAYHPPAEDFPTNFLNNIILGIYKKNKILYKKILKALNVILGGFTGATIFSMVF
jgi:hypothetical protein